MTQVRLAPLDPISLLHSYCSVRLCPKRASGRHPPEVEDQARQRAISTQPWTLPVFLGPPELDPPPAAPATPRAARRSRPAESRSVIHPPGRPGSTWPGATATDAGAPYKRQGVAPPPAKRGQQRPRVSCGGTHTQRTGLWTEVFIDALYSASGPQTASSPPGVHTISRPCGPAMVQDS
jgi:hypothetical protein